VRREAHKIKLPAMATPTKANDQLVTESCAWRGLLAEKEEQTM
jgi:hypothetical protein